MDDWKQWAIPAGILAAGLTALLVFKKPKHKSGAGHVLDVSATEEVAGALPSDGQVDALNLLREQIRLRWKIVPPPRITGAAPSAADAAAARANAAFPWPALSASTRSTDAQFIAARKRAEALLRLVMTTGRFASAGDIIQRAPSRTHQTEAMAAVAALEGGRWFQGVSS